MDIALLNVKITIQKNEVITDSIGNHRNTWTDFYSCFATVSGEGGTEKAVTGMIVDEPNISFSVRYCKRLSGIDSTKCRIVFDGDVYNIISIDHMNFKKKCLKFKCEKERKK